MRLVGAANYFIRGPYLVTGIMYGLIAGFLSFLIIWFYIWFNSAPSQLYSISQLMWELGIPKYFHANFFIVLFYQLFFGVVLGIASSAIAIGRYLKI
jgi:cell division transport system permease protein